MPDVHRIGFTQIGDKGARDHAQCYICIPIVMLSYVTRAPLYCRVTLLYATVESSIGMQEFPHIFTSYTRACQKRCKVGASSAPIMEAESKLALRITVPQFCIVVQ
jgi:hypothetical protein